MSTAAAPSPVIMNEFCVFKYAPNVSVPHISHHRHPMDMALSVVDAFGISMRTQYLLTNSGFKSSVHKKDSLIPIGKIQLQKRAFSTEVTILNFRMEITPSSGHHVLSFTPGVAVVVSPEHTTYYMNNNHIRVWCWSGNTLQYQCSNIRSVWGSISGACDAAQRVDDIPAVSLEPEGGGRIEQKDVLHLLDGSYEEYQKSLQDAYLRFGIPYMVTDEGAVML